MGDSDQQENNMDYEELLEIGQLQSLTKKEYNQLLEHPNTIYAHSTDRDADLDSTTYEVKTLSRSNIIYIHVEKD